VPALKEAWSFLETDGVVQRWDEITDLSSREPEIALYQPAPDL
jgi:hypothetical protein